MFKKKYGLHFVSLALKVNPYNVIVGKKERKGHASPQRLCIVKSANFIAANKIFTLKKVAFFAKSVAFDANGYIAQIHI